MASVKIHITPEKVSAQTCVLIDVLRATSSIVAALANGAKYVLAVSTLKEARRLKKKDVILAGERNTVKPKGFDLGNSPRSLKEEIVKGKGIVLTTTNGTKALRLLSCQNTVAASFLNISATIEYLQNEQEIHIICAGTKGRFSLEDFLLAGFIAGLDPNPLDEAAVAKALAENVRNVENLILKSSHARRLIELGMEEDIKFCLKKDLYSTVPVLKNGKFVARK